MIAYTTQTLVGNVVHGVPSGRYDGNSTAFVTTAVPAANYYGGQGAIQTLLCDVANLQAVITVQATLNDLQESAPWFDITTFGNASNAVTTVTSNTVIGNFTWIRAEITEFTAGNINLLTVAY